jgi:hypothetical protein
MRKVLSKKTLEHLKYLKTTAVFICRWLYRAVLLQKWHTFVSAVLLRLQKSVLVIQKLIRGFISRRKVRLKRVQTCDDLLRDCKSIIQERNVHSSLFVHSDGVDLTCSTNTIRHHILENCAQQFGLSYNSTSTCNRGRNSSAEIDDNTRHCVEYVR